MSQEMEFTGTLKWALITGAGKGIGKEITCILAQKGFDLVLVARHSETLKQMAEELFEDYGTHVRVFAINLSIPGSADRVFEFTQSNNITVDVLINNAGVGCYGEHTAMGDGKIEEMLHLNILSLTRLCQLYGREMKQKLRGWILNVASTAAFQPVPYFAAYGASKAYVLNFSEALAKELEDYGVTVTCHCPGPTDTEFFQEIDSRKLSNRIFAKSMRMSAHRVAEDAVKSLFKGKLTKVVGWSNYILSISSRFGSRRFAVNVSKWMARPVRKDKKLIY